jgi:hypothetical protein
MRQVDRRGRQDASAQVSAVSVRDDVAAPAPMGTDAATSVCRLEPAGGQPV